MIRILLILLALTGCATQAIAPSQSYRVQGKAEAINITGKADSQINLLSHDTEVVIYFDGIPQIKGKLEQDFSGELKGRAYEGKPTSANCTGKVITSNAVQVNCMVFIGNERTVTLTF